MSALDLTREWLRNVLRPYAAKDRIEREVMDVLGSRRTLSVKTDAFSESRLPCYPTQATNMLHLPAMTKVS